MGQMLILAGAALLVFSVLLSIIFAVFKVKYKPEKARTETSSEQTASVGTTASQPVQREDVVLPKQNQAAQQGNVVLPKQSQAGQNGTMVLPKQNQADQKGTVVLPKQNQAGQKETVVLPRQETSAEQPPRTEKGTVILAKQADKESGQIYGKEFGDTVDMQQVMRDRQ